MPYTPRRLRLEKERRKQVVSRKFVQLLGIAFLVLLAWLLIGQAQKLIINQLAKTIRVDYGELEDKIAVSAIVARHEWVFNAPVSGTLQVIAKEGQRVPEGAVIAKIVGEGSTQDMEKPQYAIYANKAGIVCYHPDSMESVVTPAATFNLDVEALKENLKTSSDTSPVKESMLNSGSPVVKVINNLKPLVLDFTVPKAAYQELPKVGDEIVLKVPGNTKKWQAEVIKIVAQKGELRIQAESSNYPDILLHQRLIDLELVKHNYRGIIIPISALINKGESQGVFKALTGDFRFAEVEVKGRVGDNAAVSGLEPGDEILVNPGIIGK